MKIKCLFSRVDRLVQSFVGYSLLVVVGRKFELSPGAITLPPPLRALNKLRERTFMCILHKFKISANFVARLEGIQIREMLVSSHPGVNYLVSPTFTMKERSLLRIQSLRNDYDDES